MNVKTALAVLDVLGLDVDTLAKHAARPTDKTRRDVEAIAEKKPE